MYNIPLVTSSLETVVSVRQFLSRSCDLCVEFWYYSLGVLQSYLLVSFLYACGILEEKQKCKQFSLHEKKTFLEELGNCDITGKYSISPVILST